jgi:hypothetical protein
MSVETRESYVEKVTKQSLHQACRNRYLSTDERIWIMTNEKDVLAALDKPSAIYSLQQRLDPSNKSTEGLQDLLMRMRTAGKVKFDINTGRWCKA